MWISTTETQKWSAENKMSSEKGSELILKEKTGKPLYGWGCCISEICVMAIRTLSEEKQKEIFDELFGKDGCGFDYCRLSIGANDFAESWYSYNETEGDYLLGWDTDEFPADVYNTTWCMYEVLKAGGLTGGFNFDAKNRKPSNTPEDMFHAFILGMDAFALGLIKAAALIEDGRVEEFVKNKYASFDTEIGRKILADETSLEELSAHAEALGSVKTPGSGSQEYLLGVVNSVLFG